MGSAFFEFNIGVSGIFAAQHGMSVTGNNMSNAGTKGYSRQILNQQASDALSGQSIGLIGTGVSVTGISRMRNAYLDTKLWGQNDKLGEYNIKVEQNSLVESIFGTPSDSGFVKAYENFFTALTTLSNTPQEAACQESVKQNAVSLTTYYNSAASTLEDYQKDLNFQLATVTDQINLLGSRIQSLNREIYQAEINSGQVANSLRDARELCIDELSELVNVDAKEVDTYRNNGTLEKHYVVKINGQVLVDHYSARKLELEVRQNKKNEEDVDGLYDIKWTDDVPFDMDSENLSGELKGIIDMRDGRGTGEGSQNTYTGIPYYIKQLNKFVQGFAESFNDVYNKDKNGVQMDPAYTFFTYIGEDGQPVGADKLTDYSKITAKNFSISAEVKESSSNIRTNFEDDPLNNITGNESSNDLLLGLVALKDDETMFKNGSAPDYMISMLSTLAISTKQSTMYQTSQTNIVNTIINQRLSVSEVDLSEELTNLIKYNQAYQAAAKLINTINEIYNTTINGLGK